MAKKDARTRAAKKFVDDIFLYPPVSPADLESRLRGVDATAVRRLLVDELDKGRISAAESLLFVEIMNVLGPGRQKNRLLRIASDHNRDKDERTYAFLALGYDKLAEGDPAMAEIGAELFDEMMSFSMLNVFMLDEEEIGNAVVEILEGMPDMEFGAHFLEMLDEQRSLARMPAHIAYADALSTESLSDLHPAMIEAIEKEGHPQGIALLEKLGSKTKNRLTRKGFRKAALKARTTMADPAPVEKVKDGVALVSSCDGQGAVVVLGRFENKDGSLSLANVCFRAEREIRDGFYLPRMSKDDFDDLVEMIRLEANTDFVEVPLLEASKLVYAVMERNQDIALDLDVQRAISCFPRPTGLLRFDSGKLPLSAADHTMEEFEILLGRPEYESWFFDLADFEQAGVTVPRDECSEQWIDEVVRRLDTPAIKDRLLAMTSHMAWWYHQKGDEESASMQLAANQDMVKDFKNSKFVKAMVVRSFFVINAHEQEDEEILYHVGDVQLRLYLKSMFFKDVKVPKGRDLAILDFTEAAYLAFDELFDSLLGGMRPKPNLLPIISYKVGKIVASTLLSNLDCSVERLFEKVARTVRMVGGFGEGETRRIATAIMALLLDFAEDVCKECRVACLVHPKKKMSDIFFASNHPSQL